MQHGQRSARSREAVAAREGANRYLCLSDRRKKNFNGGCFIFEHQGRNIDRADRKAFENFWDGIEVVGVGVRNDDCIDMAAAAGPECR